MSTRFIHRIPHRVFFASLLLISLSSCSGFLGDCFNAGRDDGGPGYGVIEILPNTVSADSETEIANSQYVDGLSMLGNVNYSSRSLISMNRTGEFFFVDSHLFSLRQKVQAPADTLSYCSFIADSDRHVCVENKPDSLFNSFTDSLVSVEVARSSISIWENLVNQQEPILTESAQFIAEDQYQVARIIHPIFSSDEQHVAYIRRTEIRQVIAGESEEEILSVQNDLMLLDRADSEMPRVLLPALEINPNLPRFLSTSPDGRYITVALNFDEFILLDREVSASTSFMTHSQPSFSSSGNYLVSIEHTGFNSRQLVVFDLESQTAVDTLAMSNDEVYAMDPNQDIIYYAPPGSIPGIASSVHVASRGIGTEQGRVILEPDQVQFMVDGFRTTLTDIYFIGFTSQNDVRLIAELQGTFYDPDSDCN